MDTLPLENRKKLGKYVRHWNTLEVARLPWSILCYRYELKGGAEKTGRFDVAEHLLEQVCLNPEYKRFGALRRALNNQYMMRDAFYELLAGQDLRSANPVMKEASIYLALYYSRVTGTFEISNFAQQYTDANNF